METTWEAPPSYTKSTLTSVVGDAAYHMSDNALAESGTALIKKAKRKKSKKSKKKKEAAAAAVEVAASQRLAHNMAKWRRLAWREGIKRVAARKRRLAIQKNGCIY